MRAEAGFVAVLLLVSVSAPASAAPAKGACKPVLIDSVPLQLVNRHYFVHSRINGFEASLLVDTGSARTLVTAALVDKLDLPPDRRHWSVVTAVGGGGNPNYDVTLADLTIGKLAVTELRVAIDGEDLSTPDFDGILGADVLMRGDVQIDFPDRIMTFYKPSPCRINAVPWTSPYLSVPVERSERSGRLLIRMALDGHPIKAVLDTGATQTVVARDAAGQAGAVGAPPGNGRGSLTDANGVSTPMQKLSFTTVEIGNERFHNVPVNVADIQLGEAGALVGLDYLQQRVVWLSPDRGHIFVLQPAASFRVSEAKR